MIQQDLSQIGIKVNLVTLDFPSLIERITRRDYQLYGELQNPEFDPLRDDPRFQRIFEQSRPAGAPVWGMP